MNISKKTAMTIICGLTLLLSGCDSSESSSGQIQEYRVQKVNPVSRTLSTPYSATIRGRQDIDIYPQVSGTITQLLAEEGETVSKGKVLFIIDQVPYVAAVHTAEANVSAAKAAVAQALLNRDSRKELFSQQVISEHELQTAENGLLSAQAQLSQAQAQLERARNELSYTQVKSPANGVIGSLPYREGALVSPGMAQPLTTISDNSTMYVYFSISENRLLSMIRASGSKSDVLANMPEVSLVLNDNTTYEAKGHIETISGVIDRATGAVSVRAAFPNGKGLLHSGGSGNVLLPEEFDSCLVIPRTATFELQNLTYVYKVQNDTVHSTRVEVERLDGKEYIVKRGLQSGDEIVMEGIGLLHDGQAIKRKSVEKGGAS